MSDTVQTTIRIPRGYADRAEGLKDHVCRVHRSGGRTTQSDVLRAAIDRGLSQLERERGPVGGTSAA